MDETREVPVSGTEIQTGSPVTYLGLLSALQSSNILCTSKPSQYAPQLRSPKITSSFPAAQMFTSLSIVRPRPSEPDPMCLQPGLTVARSPYLHPVVSYSPGA